MNKLSEGREDRKKALKSLIDKLHKGIDPEAVKEEFKEVIGDISPAEIAQIEEELIKDGMPREEIHRLCDVHIAVFRESLEEREVSVPPGHPIRILIEEHKSLLGFVEELKNTAIEIKKARDFESIGKEVEHLNHIAEHLKESESHYIREENVLFPYLEKHGITEPPAIMWTEHNKIRGIKKSLYKLIETRGSITLQDFTGQLQEVALSLADMYSNHFYKENNILFPAALKVIGADEWKEIRQEFDGLGYCCFTPEPTEASIEETETATPRKETGSLISFGAGSLSNKEIESILNTLPVDITFIDKKDTVRYFSQSKDRIFPRTKAVIGRKVQQCHPQKSVHVVNKILEDFRKGQRDTAEFWINLKGRLIYIRYFAVRDNSKDYLGCLEVTQDITDIQKMTGEKRLLD